MRNPRARFLLPFVTTTSVALGLLVLGACGNDSVAIPEGPRTEAGPGDTSPGGDSATEVDGSLDDAAVDAPPVACPDVLPVDADGVFVSGDGTNGASCGTRAAPCKGIDVGLARASAASLGKVYVAKGTYTERIKPLAGLEIIGGWENKGGTWKQGCTDPGQLTIVKAPAAQNITVDARDLGGEAKLTRLRIESKNAAQVAPGESLYGVFATGGTTTLTLTDVTIDVAAAGAGVTPPKAGNGAPGAATCAAGTGTAGASGAAGTGAPAGTYDATGYVPAVATAGSPGTAGGNGTAGAAPTCVQCGTLCVPTLCPFFPAGGETCGAAGANGCGGGEGAVGAPGTSGGTSLGVFAWDATVSLAGSRVKAGAGGDGGAGSAGGNGGAGSAGAAGANAAACTTGCAVDPLNVAACVSTTGRGMGGGAGGAGGAGGSGGTGGGGAGGSSIATYQGNAGFITMQGTTLAHGKAGAGGGAGAGAGAAGVAADHWP